MVKKTPTETPAAQPAYRARLDADGVYWGVEQVAALAPGDVEVPEGCDLKPGHYRWNPDAEPVPRFEPLARKDRRDTKQQPLAERALYELLLAMKLGGQPVPAYCEEWALWYEQTIDARGIAKLDAQPFARAMKGGA